MQRLVEDLLTLASHDSGARHTHREVNLSGIVTDSVEDARAIDPDRTYEVETPTAASTVGASSTASISDDGRYVTFLSGSDQIVPGLSGGIQSGTSVSRRAFLHDRLLGTTTLVSEFNGGIRVDEGVYDAVLAPEGDKLVYTAVKGPLSLGYSTPLPAMLHVVDLASNTRQSFGAYMSASFLGGGSHA